MQMNEVRSLADHMGHDINIHTNVYSVPTTIIEKAKVANILYSFASGQLKRLEKPESFENVDITEPVIYEGLLSNSELIAIFSKCCKI